MEEERCVSYPFVMGSGFLSARISEKKGYDSGI
jgi:hypothetical protein